MLVLGIDTSFSYVSLGLADEEGVRGEMLVRGEIGSAYELFPSLSHFLLAERLRLEDIEGYAVGIGPGSFTGLRIALAACKTFSYFTNKPLKGISTLLVLSFSLPHEGARAVAIPAYGGEVYGGAYKGKSPLVPDTICTLPQFLSLLERIKEPVYLALHPSLHPSSIPANITLTELSFPPRGGILAQLGRESIIVGERDDPLKLLPNYLRASQAERRLYGESS